MANSFSKFVVNVPAGTTEQLDWWKKKKHDLTWTAVVFPTWGGVTLYPKDVYSDIPEAATAIQEFLAKFEMGLILTFTNVDWCDHLRQSEHTATSIAVNRHRWVQKPSSDVEAELASVLCEFPQYAGPHG